jgi:hypothetical protein
MEWTWFLTWLVILLLLMTGAEQLGSCSPGLSPTLLLHVAPFVSNWKRKLLMEVGSSNCQLFTKGSNDNLDLKTMFVSYTINDAFVTNRSSVLSFLSRKSEQSSRKQLERYHKSHLLPSQLSLIFSHSASWEDWVVFEIWNVLLWQNQFRSAIRLRFDFHRAVYNLGTVLVSNIRLCSIKVLKGVLVFSLYYSEERQVQICTKLSICQCWTLSLIFKRSSSVSGYYALIDYPHS